MSIDPRDARIAELTAEDERKRLEIEHMRPTFCAALAWYPTVRAKAMHARLNEAEFRLWKAVRAAIDRAEGAR